MKGISPRNYRPLILRDLNPTLPAVYQLLSNPLCTRGRALTL